MFKGQAVQEEASPLNLRSVAPKRLFRIALRREITQNTEEFKS
jgi:hypothetical protein